MKKFLAHTVCVAALGASLAISATVGAMAKDFRLGTIVPAGHFWSKYATAMGEAIKEQSGGAHTVTVFPSGQLGDESQMVQQLQSGALDMAFLTIADVSNRIPAFGALYAPFLVDNVGDGAKLLKGETAQKLLEELPGKMGVLGMGYGIAAMRQMLSTTPIETSADLAGKKMRITPFKPFRDLYNIIGIAPTPMPLPDVYDALANGQVDAIDVDLELIMNFRFDQRAKHLLLTNHAMFPMVGLVSGRVNGHHAERETTGTIDGPFFRVGWHRANGKRNTGIADIKLHAINRNIIGRLRLHNDKLIIEKQLLSLKWEENFGRGGGIVDGDRHTDLFKGAIIAHHRQQQRVQAVQIAHIPSGQRLILFCFRDVIG